MIETFDLDIDFPSATVGDIAVINLTSACQQSWSKFWQAPLRPGIAEHIVTHDAAGVKDLTREELLSLFTLGA